MKRSVFPYQRDRVSVDGLWDDDQDYCLPIDDDWDDWDDDGFDFELEIEDSFEFEE